MHRLCDKCVALIDVRGVLNTPVPVFLVLQGTTVPHTVNSGFKACVWA